MYVVGETGSVNCEEGNKTRNICDAIYISYTEAATETVFENICLFLHRTDTHFPGRHIWLPNIITIFQELLFG